MKEPSENRKKPLLTGVCEHFISNESALKRYLKRFFFRNEDIDDMAQETFLRAYKYTRDTDIDYPKAYLYQVAKSVAMRELTKKSRQLTDFIEESCEVELDTQASLEEDLAAEQTVTLFCKAISELPPQCRRVFLMRKYQALTHREIANELNISLSAVEQHITAGVKRCKLSVDKMENNIGASQGARSEGRKNHE